MEGDPLQDSCQPWRLTDRGRRPVPEKVPCRVTTGGAGPCYSGSHDGVTLTESCTPGLAQPHIVLPLCLPFTEIKKM